MKSSDGTLVDSIGGKGDFTRQRNAPNCSKSSTSLRTGDPKGVQRPTGGHLVSLTWTMKNIYGMNDGERWSHKFFPILPRI